MKLNKPSIIFQSLLVLLGGVITFLHSTGYSANKMETGESKVYVSHPPRSLGVAAVLGQDRTGGPLSMGTCSTCHAPTGSTTMISAVLFDEFSTSVTSYDAGEDYTMAFTVTNNLYANFGFQANALTSTNGQGGDFTTALSSNTQISSVGGIEYPEHLGVKAGTGSTTFTVRWVAPINGTGTINIFGVGMGVNLNGGTAGDAPGAGGGGPMLSLTGNTPTFIDYSMATYCTSDAPNFPVITGNFSGIFSSSPAGLTIDNGSGEITPSTSTPGTYVVDYFYGSGPGALVSTVVEIIGSDAAFEYANTNYCQTDSDPTATIIGDIGGTFSGPAGVVFVDANTGEIDLDASTAGGPYTVTYSLSVPCVDIQTFDVTIDASDDPTFSYAVSYCKSDADPLAGSVASPGGTFTAPGGVVFTNSTTGEIDLEASTAGSYTITYNTTGVCTGVSTVDIVIGAEYNESISATICEDGTYLFGTTLLDSSNAGLNSQSLTSIYGCDSLLTLDLTVNSFSDNTTSLIGITIQANNSSASYVWLNCSDNYAIISGESNQAYTPVANGNYAVEITENGCVDTSACVAINTLGIIENDFGGGLIVYPNPTDGAFSIDLGNNFQQATVTLTDLSGKFIQSNNFSNEQLLKLEIEEPSGVYLLLIKSGDKKAIIRIAKE